MSELNVIGAPGWIPGAPMVPQCPRSALLRPTYPSPLSGQLRLAQPQLDEGIVGSAAVEAHIPFVAHSTAVHMPASVSHSDSPPIHPRSTALSTYLNACPESLVRALPSIRSMGCTGDWNGWSIIRVELLDATPTEAA